MAKLFSSSKKRSAAPANAASGLKAALAKGFCILYALRKVRIGAPRRPQLTARKQRGKPRSDDRQVDRGKREGRHCALHTLRLVSRAAQLTPAPGTSVRVAG